ncbi:alanine--glyoxylate aminotransferase 2 homolog 3, mitochondrial-like isoform X2 [Zingiber officinale]|uniref:alanine--glyoxylate aminotransferase 2 homolog 3, mitochondrial-like isoform X2 n=1 Tax=Zingiber officinale TaxID=94328 RepID=UPI001C4C25FC|nr:alanine--glyoxylate aminotransferase 2 homolog 3, mitochondrial-like isoform X2 [Zingiber officinale]
MKRLLLQRFSSSSSSLNLKRFFCQSSAVLTVDEHAAGPVSILPQMPRFDYTPPPYDGPRADEILRKRSEFLSPSFPHLYQRPLNIVDGKMQYLFDEDGRRYLDAFGGIATICCGHCHPEVIEAIINQTKRLQHPTVLYLNNAIADFAEALASKFPGDLKVVFFTNSGTEANELAMMIARLYTSCHDIISIRNSYHGNAAGTMGATAQCNWKFNVIQSGVHHALNPDQYRGVFGSDGEKYAKDVEEIIDFGTSGSVAGFISEAIQGVGGILELAPGYLPAVYRTIRKVGGLCIADEVQTGFARTGSHFWGFEAHGVVPDIVTMAKGIGNGIPIGAVITTPEIAQVLTGRCYFNTFGGNPVCTAAGHAVLKVLDKEKLQENALIVGGYLKDQLKALQEKHDIIGDVRGRGLIIGMELVTDRTKKTPAKTEILHVMELMKDMGVLVGKGGFYGNVFRITPPLCFTKEDSDFFVDVMDIALSKL